MLCDGPASAPQVAAAEPEELARALRAAAEIGRRPPPPAMRALGAWCAARARALPPRAAADALAFALQFGDGSEAGHSSTAAATVDALAARVLAAPPRAPPAAAALLAALAPAPLAPAGAARALARTLLRVAGGAARRGALSARAALDLVCACAARPPGAPAALLAEAAAAPLAGAAARAAAAAGDAAALVRLLRAAASAGARPAAGLARVVTGGVVARAAALDGPALAGAWEALGELGLPPPPPPLRTEWTRRVPHPVLIGHAGPSPRTNRTRRVSPSRQGCGCPWARCARCGARQGVDCGHWRAGSAAAARTWTWRAAGAPARRCCSSCPPPPSPY